MPVDLDRLIERRNTGCMKWDKYGAGVLPMWVADMDFRSPEPVIQALHERVEHGVFGYATPTAELTNEICERMERLYNWQVTPEQIVYSPGVVSAFNVACRAFATPGEGVLVQTPVYPPFLTAPANHSLVLQTAELTYVQRGQSTFTYVIDYDVFEAAITPQTRLFILCHPHNPTGVEYTRDELVRLADTCLRHDLVVVSDEIHCDLMLDGAHHVPAAMLAPELADRCITLMAPSKTFNIPGLGFSFAVIPNAELRRQMAKAGEGIVPHMNVMGLSAALAAYREAGEWLAAVLRYLTSNRDFLARYVAEHLSDLRTTIPDATYLAWLDCRVAGIEGNPFKFFLDKARVALNDGPAFGPGGEGFVRLNFGCPRTQLTEALERMEAALSKSKEGSA